MRQAGAPPTGRTSSVPPNPTGGGSAPSAPARGAESQAHSAPTTLDSWRRYSNGGASEDGAAAAPPAASTLPPRAAITSSSPSATERLKERMRQREGQGSTEPRRERERERSVGTSDWMDRIQGRKRETEEQEVMEADLKQKNSERSCRRNDAMRRVLERQAQRQQEVVQLEA